MNSRHTVFWYVTPCSVVGIFGSLLVLLTTTPIITIIIIISNLNSFLTTLVRQTIEQHPVVTVMADRFYLHVGPIPFPLKSTGNVCRSCTELFRRASSG
jgi:hypothetical protein